MKTNLEYINLAATRHLKPVLNWEIYEKEFSFTLGRFFLTEDGTNFEVDEDSVVISLAFLSEIVDLGIAITKLELENHDAD